MEEVTRQIREGLQELCCNQTCIYSIFCRFAAFVRSSVEIGNFGKSVAFWKLASVSVFFKPKTLVARVSATVPIPTSVHA